jgi:predicted O-linked N-acetylglucosamine transferase (SPINDLY family)
VRLEHGLEFAPDDSGLLEYRARFLADSGNRKQAWLALERAIAACGETFALTQRLAAILAHYGRLSESEPRWRHAVALRPTHWEPLTGLAGTLCMQGRLAEGLELYRSATKKRGGKMAVPALLLSLHYSDAESPESIFAAHRAWARSVQSRCPRPPGAIRGRRRRLRVGYVSGDFRRHSVAHFFEPLLEAHSSAVEVHCFDTSGRHDDVTARLRKLARGWHGLTQPGDDAAADAIRRAKIDVLVDLSGHTAFSRLPVFALRPAPVQATYLGYPDTTGLRSIGYRFTDSIADPPGRTEHLHSERLVRLDPCFLCYRPWLERTPVGAAPYQANGYTTLACFAIRQKLSPATLDAWAEILRRSRRTRLLLKFRAACDPAVRRDIETYFRERGVGTGRLAFAASIPSMREHLAYYSLTDLMLDPFPYNGTTATCEALWMGAPVLTWTGQSHVARVGASLLHQVGLDELVAESRQAYVDKALELLESPQRLGSWRRELRGRMRRSALMDAPRLARSIEAAYREMWRE